MLEGKLEALLYEVKCLVGFLPLHVVFYMVLLESEASPVLLYFTTLYLMVSTISSDVDQVYGGYEIPNQGPSIPIQLVRFLTNLLLLIWAGFYGLLNCSVEKHYVLGTSIHCFERNSTFQYLRTHVLVNCIGLSLIRTHVTGVELMLSINKILKPTIWS